MISKWRGGFLLGDNQQAVDKINYVSATTKIEPRWTKVHNSIKHIKMLRAGCPNTKLILRLTAPEWLFDSYIRDLEGGKSVNPSEKAKEYFKAQQGFIDLDTPKENLWIEASTPGFSSWTHSGWLNEYYQTYMDVAAAAGLHAVICNFYTGTPHTFSDGVDGWGPFMPAVNYAARNGHVIGAQAYWELPDTAMLDPDHWTAYRPLRVIEDYNFPVGTIWVPTEFGFDGPGGYRQHNISGPAYRKAWNRASETFKGTMVDGFTAFILQAWGSGWDTFLYWDIFDQLLQDMVAAGPDTSVPLPPPPITPPVELVGNYRVAVTSLKNQRMSPTSNSTLLGSIAGTNPPTQLIVSYPVTNDYVKAVGQNFWIYSPGLKVLGPA